MSEPQFTHSRPSTHKNEDTLLRPAMIPIDVCSSSLSSSSNGVGWLLEDTASGGIVVASSYVIANDGRYIHRYPIPQIVSVLPDRGATTTPSTNENHFFSDCTAPFQSEKDDLSNANASIHSWMMGKRRKRRKR